MRVLRKRALRSLVGAAALALSIQLGLSSAALADTYDDEERGNSLSFEDNDVEGVARKKVEAEVEATQTAQGTDRVKSGDSGSSQSSSSSTGQPRVRTGPTYEDLVAQALKHNQAERAKQEASEAAQANCVDGETLAHLMHSCNPTYEAQLMDMPDKPAPAAPAPQAPAPVGGAAPAPPPKITKEDVWLKAKATLSTKPATPRVGPDYSVHHLRSEVTGQPLDSVVGYPLWFWAEGGDLSAKVAKQKLAGMTVSLSMKPGKVTINPGDGNTFTCANNGTEWTPQVEAGAASPTCGYKYQKTGTYRVSMTTQWTVHYVIDNGEGEPLVGDETLHGTRTRQLRIGELQVVTVDR
ncbi:hypothetical protein [Microlunatus soli]|uniref:PKD domain-containing protein n=1 Tax=Microlunatus soli TaxID=630515 RepID=A0A1H1TYG2_9ACTN|nr:hypothetical protein [Microlunatus soli]SDS65295.1 hypothetical protein SAMN04489812_2570 [Microlunatus soli]